MLAPIMKRFLHGGSRKSFRQSIPQLVDAAIADDQDVMYHQHTLEDWDQDNDPDYDLIYLENRERDRLERLQLEEEEARFDAYNYVGLYEDYGSDYWEY
jgi:hypothetical protein